MKKVFLALFLLGSLVAGAQIKVRSNTKGLNAGAGVHTLGWASTYFEYLDKNAGSGFGGGLRVGYGITQLIEPYIAADFTSMGTGDVDAESFSMTHIDFGVRFNLAGTVSKVRPFVEGGYSSRSGTVKQIILGQDYVDVKFSGGTPHAGGGLNFFIKPSFALFAHGIFTLGKKSDLSINSTKTTDEPDVTTFRISIGAQFNLSDLISGN
ncbi:MAG: hypothetical protein EOO09_20350 [Chitinophagaceae bacterium]|nr:MAG: hypothetical protein EOO09_20350 [Chitinophagaceae bacterium]